MAGFNTETVPQFEENKKSNSAKKSKAGKKGFVVDVDEMESTDEDIDSSISNFNHANPIVRYNARRRISVQILKMAQKTLKDDEYKVIQSALLAGPSKDATLEKSKTRKSIDMVGLTPPHLRKVQNLYIKRNSTKLPKSHFSRKHLENKWSQQPKQQLDFTQMT